jgi:hypothetical protein
LRGMESPNSESLNSVLGHSPDDHSPDDAVSLEFKLQLVLTCFQPPGKLKLELQPRKTPVRLLKNFVPVR